MRLWTIHPQYLDAKGLVALWREALLAQKVLQGGTRGYRHHPQLSRFLATPRPAAALACYLIAVHEESVLRGYHFDASKIGLERFRGSIAETRGQLLYEWAHLRRKLAARDPKRFRASQTIVRPETHPLFRIIPGAVREWEKVPGGQSSETGGPTWRKNEGERRAEILTAIQEGMKSSPQRGASCAACAPKRCRN
jgi:hypothetical protein